MEILSAFQLIDIGQLMADSLKSTTSSKRIQHGFAEPNTLLRIKYFYKLLREFSLLDYNTPEPKQNSFSAKFRADGNKMFTLQRFDDALELYNEAICWAEPYNGEELALAYANRSAVYFEWKEYELCRDNMMLARGLGLPERLKQKLADRDAACEAAMSHKPEVKNEPLELSIDGPSPVSVLETMNPLPMYTYDKYHGAAALSLTVKSKYPFAANCLKVKYDKVKGQRVVETDVELKPGQIITVETPIVSAITMKDLRYRYRKCAKCYNENFLSLLPCPSCPSTMYCSQACMDDAFKHHQYECPISEFLLTYCYGDVLSVRQLLQAYATFDSKSELDEFCASYDEMESQKEFPEQFSFNYEDAMSGMEKYRYLHGLETNQGQRDNTDLLRCYCKVASLYYLLTQKTKFVDMLTSEADHDNLMKLLMRHVQVSNMNSITCTQFKEFNTSDGGDDKSINIYSQGIYPLASLLKHSCAPNVLTVSNGLTVIAYVCRTIKKGSQLTRSMGIQK